MIVVVEGRSGSMNTTADCNVYGLVCTFTMKPNQHNASGQKLFNNWERARIRLLLQYKTQ